MNWTKSSKCEAHNCVEVSFRRSTKCQHADCVEVGTTEDFVLIRDSKENGGPVLKFSSQAWKTFISSL